MISAAHLDHLRADPAMAELLARVGPIDWQARRLPSFHALTRSIIYQQLSGKAASAIFARFESLFGDGPFPLPEAVLATPPETLRRAGLSRAKTNYILNLARHAAEGLLPSLEECDRLGDEELIEKLTEVKGIGRWTVEMLLIFNLGRPDVMPIHDLGVRRGYQIAYRKRALPAPGHLLRYSKRWQPYRTTAALYLWRASEVTF